MTGTLPIAAIVLTGLSLAFVTGAILAARRRHVLGCTFSVLVALLMLSLAALAGTISVATQGYRALTREEVAVKVRVDRVGAEKLRARFSFPDGREQTLFLAGDQFYVDAHILKWKPIVNLLGLHTTYELDRVTGRYSRIEDEQTKRRTVFSLSKGKPMDMYDLRTRFPLFKPLLDAEYGSATFVTVERAADLEVRVSTTGLLIRKVTTSTS